MAVLLVKFDSLLTAFDDDYRRCLHSSTLPRTKKPKRQRLSSLCYSDVDPSPSFNGDKRSALTERPEEEELLPPRMVIPSNTNEEVIP